MGIASKLYKWILLWRNQKKLRSLPNNHCMNNNSVLVIKIDAIGDFVIWLDSAKEYQTIFPDKKVTLLCNFPCKEIAEATGFFDEIDSIDIKRFETEALYMHEQIIRLSQKEYGILIQTAYSRTQHMDVLAAVIPANKKIAFIADESKSNISRKVLTRKSKAIFDAIYDRLIASTSKTIMEIQRNKEFISQLTDKKFRSAIPQLPHIDDVELPKKPYFIIFPGASTPVKMWKTDNYAALVNYIQKRNSWDCVICGGKNEKYLYDQIKKKVIDKKHIINYCGRSSLTDLIEIVRNSELVLSNDTSGIHYAAATGVKGICPYGEYNYGRFLPYESDEGEGSVIICSAEMKCRNCSKKHMTIKCYINIFIKGRYLCLDRVTVESVIEKLKEIL